jgi:hypothetical protein
MKAQISTVARELLRVWNVGMLECARRLNLSLNTVKRYDRASEPATSGPTATSPPAPPSMPSSPAERNSGGITVRPPGDGAGQDPSKRQTS